jgi:hypothetical protein
MARMARTAALQPPLSCSLMSPVRHHHHLQALNSCSVAINPYAGYSAARSFTRLDTLFPYLARMYCQILEKKTNEQAQALLLAVHNA